MHIAANISALVQVLIIDLSLGADNAIVIGMAVAGLPKAQRRHAMVGGLTAAVILRILLAIFAVQLLHVTGLVIAGGVLLLWVCWKMYRELQHMRRVHAKHEEAPKPLPDLQPKKLSEAIVQILVADLGMSLDNILAVAGAARDHVVVLAIGLVVSIIIIGAAAAATARLMHRWPWLGWVGLFIVLYVATKMIWDGAHQISPAMPF